MFGYRDYDAEPPEERTPEPSDEGSAAYNERIQLDDQVAAMDYVCEQRMREVKVCTRPAPHVCQQNETTSQPGEYERLLRVTAWHGCMRCCLHLDAGTHQETKMSGVVRQGTTQSKEKKMLDSVKLTMRTGKYTAGIYEAGDTGKCYTRLFVTDSGRVLPTNHRALTEDDLLEVYGWGREDAYAELGKPLYGDESDDLTMEEVLGVTVGLKDAEAGRIEPIEQVEREIEND